MKDVHLCNDAGPFDKKTEYEIQRHHHGDIASVDVKQWHEYEMLVCGGS